MIKKYRALKIKDKYVEFKLCEVREDILLSDIVDIKLVELELYVKINKEEVLND